MFSDCVRARIVWEHLHKNKVRKSERVRERETKTERDIGRETGKETEDDGEWEQQNEVEPEKEKKGRHVVRKPGNQDTNSATHVVLHVSE